MILNYVFTHVMNGVYLTPSVHIMTVAKGYNLTITFIKYRVSFYFYPRGL